MGAMKHPQKLVTAAIFFRKQGTNAETVQMPHLHRVTLSLVGCPDSSYIEFLNPVSAKVSSKTEVLNSHDGILVITYMNMKLKNTDLLCLKYANALA
jgi:hypothetical protein